MKKYNLLKIALSEESTDFKHITNKIKKAFNINLEIKNNKGRLIARYNNDSIDIKLIDKYDDLFNDYDPYFELKIKVEEKDGNIIEIGQRIMEILKVNDIKWMSFETITF